VHKPSPSKPNRFVFDVKASVVMVPLDWFSTPVSVSSAPSSGPWLGSFNTVKPVSVTTTSRPQLVSNPSGGHSVNGGDGNGASAGLAALAGETGKSEATASLARVNGLSPPTGAVAGGGPRLPAIEVNTIEMLNTRPTDGLRLPSRGWFPRSRYLPAEQYLGRLSRHRRRRRGATRRQARGPAFVSQ
jgi:hypothetical protein